MYFRRLMTRRSVIVTLLEIAVDLEYPPAIDLSHSNSHVGFGCYRYSQYFCDVDIYKYLGRYICIFINDTFRVVYWFFFWQIVIYFH